jgi:hypothetical protein
MIDLASKPTRTHGRGNFVCPDCHVNLVVKEGGRCRRCAVIEREKRLKAEGVSRPWTRKNQAGRKRRDGNCAAHWMIRDEKIDESTTHEIGRCTKFNLKSNPKRLLCEDTGLPCPHNGARDFTEMQLRHPDKFTFLESCKKGGVKSGKLRGGKRGRPRKFNPGRPRALISSGRRGRGVLP